MVWRLFYVVRGSIVEFNALYFAAHFIFALLNHTTGLFLPAIMALLSAILSDRAGENVFSQSF
jgi:hypothetical protein